MIDSSSSPLIYLKCVLVLSIRKLWENWEYQDKIYEKRHKKEFDVKLEACLNFFIFEVMEEKLQQKLEDCGAEKNKTVDTEIIV